MCRAEKPQSQLQGAFLLTSQPFLPQAETWSSESSQGKVGRGCHLWSSSWDWQVQGCSITCTAQKKNKMKDVFVLKVWKKISFSFTNSFSAPIMIWTHNVSHWLTCLNTWSLAVQSTVWEGSGTFRRKALLEEVGHSVCVARGWKGGGISPWYFTAQLHFQFWQAVRGWLVGF